MHQVSQTNVHFHFIHALENFRGFDLAVNQQCDLRPIQFDFLFVAHDLFLWQAGFLFTVALLAEENDRLDFENFHNQIRNHLSEVLYLVPKAQNDCFFQEIENSIQNLKVVDALVAVLDEFLDIVSDVFQVLLFLFFFLTLINSLCLVNILNNWSFLFVGFVPVLYSFDSFDRTEFFIINIRVVRDSDKRLMNVCLWEKNSFVFCDWLLIFFFKLRSQVDDIVINKNCRNYA